MKTRILPLLILAAMTAFGAMPASARVLPVAALGDGASADVVQVYHNGRPHRAYRPYRQRIVVQPYGYYPDASPYAYYRGFEDPSFAVRGNIPGNCAVDLGYGRWESCDK